MTCEATLVTCYKAGTSDIMAAWFESVFRHTGDVPLKVVVLAKEGDADDGLRRLVSERGSTQVVEVSLGSDQVAQARVHGMMLDAYLPHKVDTEWVVTMDSDCFPVADGWLGGLMGMAGSGHAVTGILHPWVPPSKDMDRKRIEWRVRSQHCWENTHVACQLTRTADLADLGVKYAKGDDTGLLVPRKAMERGWKVAGYMLTRCPRPVHPDFNSEFNRYVGLVYGDKVFHLGGYTRVMLGDEPVFDDEYGWVRERVAKEKGAEFLLDDELSYRFKLDMEEEVAADKMRRLFGIREQDMLALKEVRRG